VQEYARSLYADTGGIEFVILDCIGFIRHYLHLFHRLRSDFLDEYQALILAEPESSVSQPVKEAFPLHAPGSRSRLKLLIYRSK
jgi:hypothetical protein